MRRRSFLKSVAGAVGLSSTVREQDTSDALGGAVYLPPGRATIESPIRLDPHTTVIGGVTVAAGEITACRRDGRRLQFDSIQPALNWLNGSGGRA